MTFKPWHYLLLGLFGGLIIFGLLQLFFLPDTGEPIQINPSIPHSDNPDKGNELVITVHIAGEVQKPGVYTLPLGSRMEDAIAIAGGLTGNADNSIINLARPIEDGLRIFIPSLAADEESGDQADSLVNINTASLDVLMSLPEIGETKANAIIEYRQTYGFFTTPEELMQVAGIGDKIFSLIKDLITTGN